MIPRSLPALFAATLFSVSPGPAAAQGLFSLDDIAQVTVLSGWRTDRGTHMAAIRIEMADGWKTYWRSAGVSGITPRIDWSASENIGNVDVLWPTPTVYGPEISRSYGYDGVVVIPIELTPLTASTGAISVRAQMDIGVCADICLPMSVELSAELPASGAPDPIITASLNNRPTSAQAAGLRSATCSYEPIADGLRFSAQLDLPRQGNKEVVVFEYSDRSVWIANADALRDGPTLTAVADMVPPNAAPFPLDRSDIRITVFGNKGAVDIQGCTAR